MEKVSRHTKPVELTSECLRVGDFLVLALAQLRNMWKPTQQPGLWFHGGNLHQSRHYSLYLALQIKARQEGLPTPVYGISEVHHRA